MSEDYKRLLLILEEVVKKLEFYQNEERMRIAFENLMHDAGQRPCPEGFLWDRSIGKCARDVENSAPVVNAGIDLATEVGKQVSITASVIDKENNVVSTKWNQLVGVPVNFNVSADGKTISFVANTEGLYEFVFTATDAEGLSGSDSVQVLVEKDVVEAKKYKLILFGDDDTRADSTAIMQAYMKEQDVAQYIFLGDGPYSESGTKWVGQKKQFYDENKRKMLILTRGNHDTKSSESMQTQRDIEAWYPEVKNGPVKDAWLTAKHVNNSYIFTIDSEDMDVEFKREQYDWVVKQLNIAKSLRDQGKIDWIIVTAHKPWFTLKSSHSPYTAVRKIYSDLFRQYGVDFVTHGHNHNTQLWYPMIDDGSTGNGTGKQLFTRLPTGEFDFSKDHGQAFIIEGHSGHESNGINDSGDGVKNVMYYDDEDDLMSYTIIEIEGKKAKVYSKDRDGKLLYEYSVIR